jgi:hypothetical protein
MMHKKKYKLLFWAFLFVIACKAQPYYHASLSAVSKSGFYKINLPPSLIAKSNESLQDIRIIDNSEQEVPYILKTDLPAFTAASFISFPILSAKKEVDKQTHITIENKASTPINRLLLIIKNTDAYRTVTLSGSDNLKQWFVIKENISLDNYLSSPEAHFIQSLSFPNSQYAYFKITINGEDVLPVHISQAGIYRQTYQAGKHMLLPAPIISQKDSSDKKTYVTLAFDDTYTIDRFELTISGSRFYNRTFTINNTTSADYNNSYTLNAAAAHSFNCHLKGNQLYLVIKNNDNPPLKINKVKAYQLNNYLIAWLEKGIEYKLTTGDSLATTPQYDLAFFKDSAQNPIELMVGAITNISLPISTTKKNSNHYMLWIILAAVLVLLLLLTRKLTTEVNKKK